MSPVVAEEFLRYSCGRGALTPWCEKCAETRALERRCVVNVFNRGLRGFVIWLFFHALEGRYCVPAPARGGEKNILEGRLHAVKCTHPIILCQEGVHESFTEFVVSFGG